MEEAIKIAMSRTWAEINLDSLEKNINILKKLLVNNNTRFLAVCKANAYGQGMIQIAQKCQQCKVDYLAIASIKEAIELRQNGITIPILCLGQTPSDLTEIICEYNITQTIENLEIAKEISENAEKLKKKVKTHIKIDTGMGRIGIYWPEAGNTKKEEKAKITKEISEICHLQGLDIEGIYTHFANADKEEYTKIQINKFKEVLEYLSKEGINIKIAHSSASVGVYKYPEAHFDMGRFGLILYGYASTDTGNKKCNLGLIPVMTVKGRISTIRHLPKGSTVSYGCTYTLKGDSKLAVLPIGYGDGYPRRLGNIANVKIKNKLCPLIGRVCMDMIIVDVTDISDVKTGDIAIVYDEELVTQNAEKANTIIHKLVTQVMPRVTRLYIEHGKISL